MSHMFSAYGNGVTIAIIRQRCQSHIATAKRDIISILHYIVRYITHLYIQIAAFCAIWFCDCDFLTLYLMTCHGMQGCQS